MEQNSISISRDSRDTIFGLAIGIGNGSYTLVEVNRGVSLPARDKETTSPTWTLEMTLARCSSKLPSFSV